MAKIEYSQAVRKKLHDLKRRLTDDYGEEKSNEIVRAITQGVRRLESFPQSGIALSSIYSLDCDYRFIFVKHNYFFYRIINETTVMVLEMFHEKEDFMQKLFGIKTITQETEEYWDE